MPPGFGAQKVISVDTVQNTYPLLSIPVLPSIVNVGDAFALLVETAHPSGSYSLFITKPDGSQYVATAPQLYVGEIDSRVKQGLFPAGSYVVLQIPASFVDQHGFWTCFIQAIDGVPGPIGRFYIGPPTVLA